MCHGYLFRFLSRVTKNVSRGKKKTLKGGGEKEGWSEEGAGKGSRGIGESGEGEGRVPQSFVRG